VGGGQRKEKRGKREEGRGKRNPRPRHTLRAWSTRQEKAYTEIAEHTEFSEKSGKGKGFNAEVAEEPPRERRFKR
jgi:hypothetical protein